MEYPTLSPGLADELAAVEPSHDGRLEYRPCRVTLRDGRVLDRVYVVEADEYFRLWGVWPENDRAKRSLALDDVAHIESSPVRLPACCADKVYVAGESGMGYMVFVVVLNDGRHLPFLTGNAVDFPALPEGVGTSDVADVLPHEGRERLTDATRADQRGAAYYWCLYSSRPESADTG